MSLKFVNVEGVEAWREYDFSGRVYRIEKPKKVQWREGGATHRVTDAENVVHCVPAPGTGDCVLRWSGDVIA